MGGIHWDSPVRHEGALQQGNWGLEKVKAGNDFCLATKNRESTSLVRDDLVSILRSLKNPEAWIGVAQCSVLVFKSLSCLAWLRIRGPSCDARSQIRQRQKSPGAAVPGGSRAPLLSPSSEPMSQRMEKSCPARWDTPFSTVHHTLWWPREHSLVSDIPSSHRASLWLWATYWCIIFLFGKWGIRYLPYYTVMKVK